MARRVIDIFWDRKTRNDINDNFKELYDLRGFFESGGTITMDGSPSGVYESLSDLKNDYPNGDDRIFIVDGDWYYWDGNEWVKGGIYQAHGVGDNTVGFKQLYNSVKDATLFGVYFPINDIAYWEYGSLIRNPTEDDVEIGDPSNVAYKNRIRNSDYIRMKKGTIIRLKDFGKHKLNVFMYDIATKKSIGITSWINNDFIIPTDCYVKLLLAFNNDDNIAESEVLTVSDSCEIKIPVNDKVVDMVNLVSNSDGSNGENVWLPADGIENIDGWLCRTTQDVTETGGSRYFTFTQDLPDNAFENKLIDGNKYYIKSDFKVIESDDFKEGTVYYNAPKGVRTEIGTINKVDESVRCSDVFTYSDEAPKRIALMFNFGNSTGKMVYGIKNILLINLTEIFGEGNEPDKHQVDDLIDTFDSSWFDVADSSTIAKYLLTNGVPDKGNDHVKKEFFFAEDITGELSVEENDMYVFENGTETTTDEVYSVYDSLMNEFDGYISKESIAKDPNGTDILCYTFKPHQAQAEDGVDFSDPIVVISNGIHGNEKGPVFGTYNFMKQICENWRHNELSSFYRMNIIFKVIPVLNPSGFDNYERRNGNNVDLNRDYPRGIDFDDDYSNKENETQAVIKMMRDYKEDIIVWIDYHNMYWNDEKQYLSYATGRNPIVSQSVNRTINLLGRKWQAEYELFPQSLTHDFGHTVNGILNTVTDCANETGIPAVTLEAVRKVEWQDSWSLYDELTMKITVELLANSLKSIIRNTR